MENTEPKKSFILVDNANGDGHQISDLMRNVLHNLIPDLEDTTMDLPDFVTQEEVDRAYGIMEWFRHVTEDEEDFNRAQIRGKAFTLKALYEQFHSADMEGFDEFEEFVHEVCRCFQRMERYCTYC